MKVNITKPTLEELPFAVQILSQEVTEIKRLLLEKTEEKIVDHDVWMDINQTNVLQKKNAVKIYLWMKLLQKSRMLLLHM